MTEGYVEEQLDNRPNNSDEIDLFDLWDDVVENKVWVLAGLLGCIILAALYLLRATEIFETQVVIKPPSDVHVLELNPPQLSATKLSSKGEAVIYEDEIFGLTAEQAYQEAQKAVLSKEYRKAFFKDHIPVIEEFGTVYSDKLLMNQNFANFDRLFSFSVSNAKKDTEQFTKLSFEFPDSQESAELLNAFVVYALVKKLEEIKTTLSGKVQAEILNLQYQVDKLKEEYKGERNRTLLLLNEAKHIAEKVGINKPAFDKNQVLTEEPPLYMYGSKALNAEIGAIKNRDSMAKDLSFGEEYFIEGVSQLLYRIDQLKKLEVDYSKVKLALIDEEAIPPTSPIKPKKLLILALAGVAGLFGGIMLALIMAAFKRHKEARRRRALKRLEKKNG
ncbi:hypothetical protein HF888_06475 [Bermanella marisrubri]|uniref:Lipopolysaccharide biosynthesis n=1 Tax=Bermanella marisrubri TaxID=207949 RepID=Q1N5G1_9GAMM|nr:Wzz/FepE/Etk N-terminal domain-containing protein [Bermanella marisrubri]EAT13116.1 Lipopolysaccharide biosynthesis [Oceanobacter sp. RED65] [Bermanella marisrubri]QIZ83894.1 hypothetical protein HF888_06475 [Bermanella marisrubri]